MQMETSSVNTSISTQTEDINATKDKCVGSTLKYQKKKNVIQGWTLWLNQSRPAQYKGSQSENT